MIFLFYLILFTSSLHKKINFNIICYTKANQYIFCSYMAIEFNYMLLIKTFFNFYFKRRHETPLAFYVFDWNRKQSRELINVKNVFVWYYDTQKLFNNKYTFSTNSCLIYRSIRVCFVNEIFLTKILQHLI